MNNHPKYQAIVEKVKAKFIQDPRNNKAALTGVTTLIIKGITVGTALLSIPITAQYLGREQFGIWLLLSTFLSWTAIADLGLTNSLMNILTTALAKGDARTAQQSVATAFYALLSIGSLLLFGSIASSFLVPWEQIFNLHLSAPLQQEIHSAVVISMCIFALRIPLSMPRCMYAAYQQGYIYQLWLGLSNVLSLISLFIAEHYHANLPWLIGIFFGVMSGGDVLAGIDIFYFRQRWLNPQLKAWDGDLLRELLQVGFQFWIPQICSVCIFQTDLIVVSMLFGVSEVGTYGILLRLFSAIDSVSSSFLNPLWPAYNEAKARGDFPWIYKTFQKSILRSSAWSTVAGIILVISAPTILKYWIGKDISAPIILSICMLLTYILLPISQGIAMLVNGLGEIKFISYVAPIAALTNIFLSFLLGKIIGTPGVTLATAICIFTFSILLVGGDLFLKLNKTS